MGGGEQARARAVELVGRRGSGGCGESRPSGSFAPLRMTAKTNNGKTNNGKTNNGKTNNGETNNGKNDGNGKNKS
ncbi:MAG TPA: hypothetical protein VK608_14040 [Edaphobacter sp.]|nr:hypothetical protein [Edaphobacter sp.]